MISLVKDTITPEELQAMARWLESNPRLTKGDLTREFEAAWADWQGAVGAVFTNSGSSANFLMFDALINSKRLKSKNIVAPAVSWVTTVAPIIQLGLNPLLCDADPINLGLNPAMLEDLLKKNTVGAVILVHVLGVPNHMEEITYLCSKYNTPLLEDCCEAPGAMYDGKRVGTFGEMSSFSFYYGHHMSTIEGGMVCVNDEDLRSIILSIRSHGWARDLPDERRAELERKNDIDWFQSLYTFYYAGYNFRPTEISAFLGLSQLRRLDNIVRRRNEIYFRYLNRLQKKITCLRQDRGFVSSLAFGLTCRERQRIVDSLRRNDIESRPLICGSIGRQPFWKALYGPTNLKVADEVHDTGFYLPVNQDLLDREVDFICDVVLDALEGRSL